MLTVYVIGKISNQQKLLEVNFGGVKNYMWNFACTVCWCLSHPHCSRVSV